MLCISEFEKYYGKQKLFAIDKLQLSAPLYWLRGANGAGKSTFLKAVAGLIPFQGEISWQTPESSLRLRPDVSAYRLAVSYSEAEPLYPSFLRGTDLLSFYEQAKKGNRKESVYLMEKLGITPFIDQKCGGYSSGMSKKLSLLLAFTGQPQLILLDEPLTTLDHASVQHLQELIAEYIAGGTTFLLTSHQPLNIPGHAPKELFLEDGNLKSINPNPLSPQQL